jgi:hypothetical protein
MQRVTSTILSSSAVVLEKENIENMQNDIINNIKLNKNALETMINNYERNNK